MIRNGVTFLVVIGLFHVGGAFAQMAFSGTNLLRYCEQGVIIINTPSGVRSGADSKEAMMCAGFLEGARMGILAGEKVSGEREPRFFCSPDGVSGEQYLRVAVQWMRQHPEQLHEHGVVLIAHAFHEAFPCKSQP